MFSLDLTAVRYRHDDLPAVRDDSRASVEERWRRVRGEGRLRSKGKIG
jgi:hypothetical protein